MVGTSEAAQVRLPLAVVVADEATKMFEAHAGPPLIERPGSSSVRGDVV
jgi:hypothetical protein